MLFQTQRATHGSQRYEGTSATLQLLRQNRRNSIFGRSLVESIAGSEQNAPSHERHDSGEVAERLTNSPGANLDREATP